LPSFWAIRWAWALRGLVHDQGGGGVLTGGHQQAVADPGAIHEGLQVGADVVAAEAGRGGAL